jgi:hypothetical protein
MLRRVALVRTDVSEELSASIIRVARIGELGTTLAATSNRRTLRRNTMPFLLCCDFNKDFSKTIFQGISDLLGTISGPLHPAVAGLLTRS